MIPEFLTGTFFDVFLLKGYDTKKKPIEDDSVEIEEEHSGSHQADAAKIFQGNKAQQTTGSDNGRGQGYGKD